MTFHYHYTLASKYLWNFRSLFTGIWRLQIDWCCVPRSWEPFQAFTRRKSLLSQRTCHSGSQECRCRYSKWLLLGQPSRWIEKHIIVPTRHSTIPGIPDNGIPQEYLNSISISGMPLHLTTLKAGSIVILLRNMDYSGGLCNGPRLIIVDLGNHVTREDSNGKTSRRNSFYSTDLFRYSFFLRPSFYSAAPTVPCTTCFRQDDQ